MAAEELSCTIITTGGGAEPTHTHASALWEVARKSPHYGLVEISVLTVHIFNA